MSKKFFIYFSFLLFIVNALFSLSFKNQYSTYELDFSSDKQEFSLNTNSKFNFFFKDEAWIYVENANNNSFIRLLSESYQDGGAMFTFQTSRNVGNIVLTFKYQNVKDAREFTKNVVLKITKQEEVSKLDKMNPGDNLDLDKSINLNNGSLSSKDIMRRALNLSYINDYKGAIELLNRYDFDDNDYTLLKAKLYYKDKDYLNSYLSYLSLRDMYFNEIFLNLIELGIKLNKVENVLRDVRFLVENNIDFSEDIYLDILEFLLMNGEYDFFLNLSLLYYPKYMNSRFPDRYNYLLGKLYETESKYKNFVESLSYYKRVVDGYPFSNYYELSKLRYLFLKRFF
ncbi:hypothetical protein CDQ96_00205 [Borrelia miyamotoi]|uniref:hypothetical protein n=1 Tax=Borrelia miyamotoi TaxID=47466 RepID=UPI000B8DA111|nr:hypothetical protein [Borrelia miyamotoi]ASQ28879.1 hypothetical protein CDQ96_00205 [Borrelia miyamotoi]